MGACKNIPYAKDSETAESFFADDYITWTSKKLTCPYCNWEVIYKWSHIMNNDGTPRLKHFAHKVSHKCVNKIWSFGEWELHKSSKDYIFSLLQEYARQDKIDVIHLEKEFELQDSTSEIYRIADIYFEFVKNWRTYKKAYEIQYSQIPLKEFELRHKDYIELGIEDIWFVGLQYRQGLNKKELKLKDEYKGLWDMIQYISSDSRAIRDYVVDDTQRPLMRKLCEYPDETKRIEGKCISLYEKISSFQDITFFVMPEGIYHPKSLELELYWAESYQFAARWQTAFTDMENFNNFWMSHIYAQASFWNLPSLETLIKYNFQLFEVTCSNFVYIESNGYNTLLWEYTESELLYRENTIKRLELIEKKRQDDLAFERKYELLQWSDPFFTRVYVYRWYLKLTQAIDVLLDQTKKSTARVQWDSLKWMNTKVLKPHYKNRANLWFFSGLNSMLWIMYKSNNEFIAWKIEDILSEKLIEMKLFIQNNNVTDLNFSYDEMLEFWIPKVNNRISPGPICEWSHKDIKYLLRNYCREVLYSSCKGNMERFLFWSILRKNSEELLEVITKELSYIETHFTDNSNKKEPFKELTLL